MLVWLLGSGWGMIGEYYRIGWPGGMRGALVKGGISPAAWLAYGSGLGEHPLHAQT